MAFFTWLNAVSTSSWLRSSCMWPLSMRPEQTAKSPCCRGVMTILSKMETLLENHESFEEAPALIRVPQIMVTAQKPAGCIIITQCNGLLWRLLKIVSDSHPGPISLPTVLPYSGHSTGGSWEAEQSSWLTHRAREEKLEYKPCWSAVHNQKGLLVLQHKCMQINQPSQGL